MIDNKYDKSFSVARRGFLKGAAGVALAVAAGCGTGDEDDSGGNAAADNDALGGLKTNGSEASLIGPKRVPAGSYHTWSIQYRAGKQGMPKNGRFAFSVEHGADWGEAKFFGRDKQAGTSLSSKARAVIANNNNSSGNAVEVEFQEDMKFGQTATITIGHPERDGGLLRAPTVAHKATIKVFENLYGERDERGYLIYVPVNILTVEVMPLETVTLNVIAKSKVTRGKNADLVVRAEDKYGNITPDYTGSLDIFDDESWELLGRVAVTENDLGWKKISNVILAKNGIIRLRIEDAGNGFVAWSDPIEVTDDAAHEGVIWGQMHGHSLVSDGLGTAREYYDYAREKGNLDYCALTDHGHLTEDINHRAFFRHYIDEDMWKAYAGETQKANDPGSFVTFLAYEWTSHIFSDKNVYFFDDQTPWEEYPNTLRQLYARYRGRKVMIISHMMWAVPFMRATNWNHVDTTLERVVEVCSVHGAREYANNPYFPEDEWSAKMWLLMAGHMAADSLSKGHKLGFMCAADTHTGCPGNSISGIQPCRVDGLMAIRSPEITRGAIWDRWYDRKVYGTTGPRILLDFYFDGHPMGSEVTASNGPREFNVAVYGKMGIEKIELVSSNPQKSVDVVTFDEPVWNPGAVVLSDDDPPGGDTYYYVRVYQEDGHLAWSSPIWIS